MVESAMTSLLVFGSASGVRLAHSEDCDLPMAQYGACLAPSACKEQAPQTRANNTAQFDVGVSTLLLDDSEVHLHLDGMHR